MSDKNLGQEVYDDSPASFLRLLASNRGEVLTDQEYESARIEFLASLERPKIFERAVVLPGALFLAIGLPFIFSGVRKWGTDVQGAMETMFIGCLISGLGAMVVVGHLIVMRRQRGRAMTDRLADVDELIREGLVSKEEFDRIRNAVLLNFGST